MIDEITDFLFGLKMTIISGIFLLIAVIFMILGIDTPIYLNPAWGTVIISGICFSRLVYIGCFLGFSERCIGSTVC